MNKLFSNIFILIFITFLGSCQTNRDKVLAFGNKKIIPSQTGKNITMFYSDSTILKIKLITPLMLMYDKGVKEPFTVLPNGVFVKFFEDGKESTSLKGNYAIRYEITQKMIIKYNVEIINLKGEKLNTESLVWDEQKRKITTDAYVKITTAKEEITGTGLEANQDFSQYEIKNVIGKINIEENDL
jgi:LPS export ABC transporter protein LptC